MGCYGRLSLGSLTLAWIKDFIEPGLMRMFRPADGQVDLLDQRHHTDLLEYVSEDIVHEFDTTSPFPRIAYRCTSAVARDRLDLSGVTYGVSSKMFESGVADRIASWQHNRFGDIPELRDECRVLQSLTMESWLSGIRRIRNDGITRDTVESLPSNDLDRPLLLYMLRGFRGSFGYPGDTHCFMLRLLLEEAAPGEEVVYDLSGLSEEYLVGQSGDILSWANDLIDEDFLAARRTIVLTEGPTDSRLLSRSLALLYPHLVEYFHFFDFKRKSPGGVGELANLVRAFSAASIQHRILALFDNDTAARAALSTFDLPAIPSNIAVYHYPEFSLARRYPTIGPTGKADMDVNGLAGGIELYLGKDTLTSPDGTLRPIQWTGYNPKLRSYQGEVFDKRSVVSAFEERLETCEDDLGQISRYDWTGIRAILSTMLSGFTTLDEDAILNGEIYL